MGDLYWGDNLDILRSCIGDTSVIRKELRRESGHSGDEADLVRPLRATVIRPEALTV